MRYKHSRNYRNNNRHKDNRNNYNRIKEKNKDNNPPPAVNDKIKFVSTNVVRSNEIDNKQQNKKKKSNGQFFNLFNNQKRNSSVRNSRYIQDNRNRRQNREERENIKNKSELQRLFRENKNNFNKTLIEQKNIKLPSFRKKISIYKVNELKEKSCAYCKKKIIEMSTAIMNEDDKYFHFDCIIKELEEKNKDILKPAQRIVYLGNNTFGIIEEFKENGKIKFKINEKINYKNKQAI
ncbi:MAG: hypothetical protein JXB50_02605 [Spirochaetes bacterium]|nr:hypothetical protein [Spirochaetota bacterium]